MEHAMKHHQEKGHCIMAYLSDYRVWLVWRGGGGGSCAAGPLIADIGRPVPQVL